MYKCFYILETNQKNKKISSSHKHNCGKYVFVSQLLLFCFAGIHLF